MKKQKSFSQKFWGSLIWINLIVFICFLILIGFVVLGIMQN